MKKGNKAAGQRRVAGLKRKAEEPFLAAARCGLLEHFFLEEWFIFYDRCSMHPTFHEMMDILSNHWDISVRKASVCKLWMRQKTQKQVCLPKINEKHLQSEVIFIGSNGKIYRAATSEIS